MPITSWTKLRSAGRPAERPSAAKRGYGRDWQRTRARKLADSPLCEDCLTAGTVTPATQVHHVLKAGEAPSQRHNAENLMALCESCHSTRTARGE